MQLVTACSTPIADGRLGGVPNAKGPPPFCTSSWLPRPALLLGPNGAFWSHALIQVLCPSRQEGVLRIAVTGASGRIGGQVVRLVAAEEPHQVVALSRRGLPSGRWPPGVSARAADYGDPQALGAALRDVDTLVFVSSDGPVAKVMVHHQNVIRAADDGGVAHIVALSGLDADLSSPFCYAVSYGYTERLLARSGCPVSIARASIYSEFFLGFLARARASGQLRLPAAYGRISLVSRSDVARCLAALALAPASGRYHDITGPQSLDLAAIAAAGAREWGTPLKYVDITPGEHCADMAAAEEDPWWMYAYSTMFASIREQRWAAVSGEVHSLTGRSPTAVHTALARSKTA
jgi:NAD(P)H dehydrogenase (quinone)